MRVKLCGRRVELCGRRVALCDDVVQPCPEPPVTPDPSKCCGPYGSVIEVTERVFSYSSSSFRDVFSTQQGELFAGANNGCCVRVGASYRRYWLNRAQSSSTVTTRRNLFKLACPGEGDPGQFVHVGGTRRDSSYFLSTQTGFQRERTRSATYTPLDGGGPCQPNQPALSIPTDLSQPPNINGPDVEVSPDFADISEYFEIVTENGCPQYTLRDFSGEGGPCDNETTSTGSVTSFYNTTPTNPCTGGGGETLQQEAVDNRVNAQRVTCGAVYNTRRSGYSRGVAGNGRRQYRFKGQGFCNGCPSATGSITYVYESQSTFERDNQTFGRIVSVRVIQGCDYETCPEVPEVLTVCGYPLFPCAVPLDEPQPPSGPFALGEAFAELTSLPGRIVRYDGFCYQVSPTKTLVLADGVVDAVTLADDADCQTCAYAHMVFETLKTEPTPYRVIVPTDAVPRMLERLGLTTAAQLESEAVTVEVGQDDATGLPVLACVRFVEYTNSPDLGETPEPVVTDGEAFYGVGCSTPALALRLIACDGQGDRTASGGLPVAEVRSLGDDEPTLAPYIGRIFKVVWPGLCGGAGLEMCYTVAGLTYASSQGQPSVVSPAGLPSCGDCLATLADCDGGSTLATAADPPPLPAFPGGIDPRARLTAEAAFGCRGCGQ